MLSALFSGRLQMTDTTIIPLRVAKWPSGLYVSGACIAGVLLTSAPWDMHRLCAGFCIRNTAVLRNEVKFRSSFMYLVG